MMSMFRGFSRVVFAGLPLLVASVAHAGPVERMADIALHPSNPDVMVVRYLQGGTGLLYTSDGGRSFRLLCASVIARDKPNGPTAIASDGRVLIGTFNGMWQDNGQGCSWSTVEPAQGRWITDFAVDPTDPARMYTVSGNGGEGVQNGIMRSAAPGQWMDIGSRDPVGITRVRVAKTGSGSRIYQSVLRVPTMTMMTGDAGASQPNYLVRVSDDEGQTWKEHQVPDMGGPFRLEAIDPTNPDRIVGSITREGMPDDVLVSSNQGETFTSYLKVNDLGGLTTAPDGRIWIGESQSPSASPDQRGLYYAPKLDMPAMKVADIGVECLAFQPANSKLLVCQAFAFGTVDPTSWTFTELFHFRAAKEFVKCDGMNVAEMCQVQMCADYCAAGHFAQAPLCCAYNTDSCGPLVAEMEGTGSPAMCMGASGAAGSGGQSAAGSAAAGSGAAGSAAAGTGAAGRSTGTAGSVAGKGAMSSAGSEAEPKPEKSSGCSCAAVGSESERMQLWAAGLLLAALITRWRRRR